MMPKGKTSGAAICRLAGLVVRVVVLIVTALFVNLSIPVFEDAFFAPSCTSKAFAQNAAQDNAKEEPFPFDVQLPPLTPEMKEVLKKYGFFENRNDKGELQYFVFDKETNDIELNASR
jgi:hypothetical protein